jgi:hypothetical protein
MRSNGLWLSACCDGCADQISRPNIPTFSPAVPETSSLSPPSFCNSFCLIAAPHSPANSLPPNALPRKSHRHGQRWQTRLGVIGCVSVWDLAPDQFPIVSETFMDLDCEWQASFPLFSAQNLIYLFIRLNLYDQSSKIKIVSMFFTSHSF